MSLRTLPEARFAVFTAVVALLATLFLVTNAQADSELEPCAKGSTRQTEQYLNDCLAQCAELPAADLALHEAVDAAER